MVGVRAMQFRRMKWVETTRAPETVSLYRLLPSVSMTLLRVSLMMTRMMRYH